MMACLYYRWYYTRRSRSIAFPGDPADRLIAASAILHSAALVTKDERIRAFDGVRCIWQRPDPDYNFALLEDARMSSMTRSLFICAGFALAAACTEQQPPPPQPQQPQAPQMSQLERGKYLVGAMGCDDCHTPWKMGANGPEPDMTRRLSGHPENMKVDKPPKLSEPWAGAVTGTFTAWAGPWGISYTANLTSDKNTGIGQEAWTEELFIKAIREGKHMGTSRPILPPMPWPAFRNLNDDDLKAIFAFLRTVPAINNHVPDPVLAEPPKK